MKCSCFCIAVVKCSSHEKLDHISGVEIVKSCICHPLLTFDDFFGSGFVRVFFES